MYDDAVPVGQALLHQVVGSVGEVVDWSWSLIFCPIAD